MFHLPRRLRYFGFACMSLALAATGAVFGVQMADRTVCVTLQENSSRQLVIYDPSHDSLLPETRYSSAWYWTKTEDYVLSAQPRRDNAQLYTLVLESTEGGDPIVLEEEIYQSSSSGFSPRASWSSDQRLLAYIWQDVEHTQFLTIFNLEDHSKRSAPLAVEGLTLGNLWAVDWSADGAYLMIRVLANQPFIGLWLWSVEDMSLIPLDFEFTLINASSTWSSAGHRLAVVVQPLGDVEPELYIINPDDVGNPIQPPLNLSSVFVERVYAVSWSTNSAYITVVKQRSYRVNEGRNFIRQWFYDIYSSEGALLERDIAGKALLPNAPASSNGVTLVTQAMVPGFWMKDGNLWLFLQDTFEGAVPTTRLMAYNPETEAFDTLEDQVVPSLYEQMFELPFRYTFSANEAIVPVNHHLLLPQWRDGAITLDYIDYERDTRFTLIEGADEVLLDYSFLNLPPMYSVAEGYFVIPWWLNSGGNTETRLTMLRSDDGEVLMEVAGMEDIEQVNWFGDDWVSFVAVRDGVRGIEVVNMKTGVHHRLLEGVEEESRLYGTLSPDEQNIALIVTSQGTYTGSEVGRLYLVSLESGTAQFIHEEASPYGSRWSPDGSSLAFMRPGAYNRLGVQVVSSAGEIIGDIDMPIELGANTRSIYMWSHCEANPIPEWK